MATTMEQRFGRDFYETVLGWVQDNLGPDDVFSTTQLTEWAEASDFVHKED